VRNVTDACNSAQARNSEELLQAPLDGDTVQGALSTMIGKMGENISLRRVHRVEAPDGVIAPYIHNKAAEGVGLMGVLVALRADSGTEAVQAIGTRIAMHVAAANPSFVDRASVDAEVVEKEREVLTAQALETGKNPKHIDKMIDGRLNKFYKDICLLDQVFLAGGDSDPQSVQKFIAASAKELGVDMGLTGFARFSCGEGVEKEEGDYAAEVAAMAGMGS